MVATMVVIEFFTSTMAIAVAGAKFSLMKTAAIVTQMNVSLRKFIEFS